MTIEDNEITPLTRRSIVDYLNLEKIPCAGRLDESDFLGRTWDLRATESYDGRYRDAAGNIYQHRVNNGDWEGDWVFSDPRFDLPNSADDRFLEFLAQTLHRVVRANVEDVRRLVDEFNSQLPTDGFALVETGRIGGRVGYCGTQTSAAHDPANAIQVSHRLLLKDPAILHDHLDRVRRPLPSMRSQANIMRDIVYARCESSQLTPPRRAYCG